MDDAQPQGPESQAVGSDELRAAAFEVADIKRQVQALLADAQGHLATLAEVISQATALKARATDDQAVIAMKSGHINDAQLHADNVRADLDRALTSAKQSATEAEGLRSRAQSAADQSAAVLADVRTAKASADAEAASAVRSQTTAEAAALACKTLADRSDAVEKRVAGYETQLEQFAVRCSDLLKTVEGLLPGSTAAGLAHAFDQRRQTFLQPHRRWQWVFVGSVLSIVALAGTGLWHFYHASTAPTYDELARLWIARLPIAAALVWLALHASREVALSKRLEEDYGFKSAIAACFEGFKRQVADTDTGVNPQSALAKLLNNTLATIAEPPGRIYAKHALTVSPAKELAAAAKAVTGVTNAGTS